MAHLLRWLALPAMLLLSAATDPQAPAPRTRAAGWMQRHQDKLLEIHRGPVDLIFLGDSITQELENTNPAWGEINSVWQRFYACRHAINLGFNGDTTSSLLWRISNGELDGIHPRLVVLMVGTNNIRPAIASTSEGTAQAIGVLVKDIHHRLPSSRILLLGIPPSGRGPETENKRMAVNATLATRDWTPENTAFVNVDSAFAPGGTLNTALFREGTLGRGVVHPNAQGWSNLAELLEPNIRKILGGNGCR